jgi:hypothetical protein
LNTYSNDVRCPNYIYAGYTSITERIQTLAKSKSGDSIFTGREFQSRYTTAGISGDIRNPVAFAGGNIQTAYSNVCSVYETVRNRNNNRGPKFKLNNGDDELNYEMVNGKLWNADEKLEQAEERIESVGDRIQRLEYLLLGIQKIGEDIQLQIETVEQTQHIVVRLICKTII